MNAQYKKDEKILKDIIKKNVKPANNTHEINIIIYYKNLKVNNLKMYNDLTKDTDISSKSHAVCEVLCLIGGCALPNPSYIGQTRDNVKSRLNQHRQNGAILEHLQQSHNINTVQLDTLLSNVKILKIIPDYHKLTIYEALAILHRKSDLNRQIDNFVNPLKLFSRSTHITNIIKDPLQNMNIINYNYTNLATFATPQPSTSLIPHRYPTPNRSSNN